MRSGAVHRTRKTVICAGLFFALAATGVLFLNSKKEELLSEGLHFFERKLNTEGDLKVTFGSFSGSLLGVLRFKDLRVERPRLLPEQRLLFRADEIEIRYRPQDFISKRFDSGISVTVRKPEVHWMPRPALRTPKFPFIGWMRHWAVAQRKNFNVHVTGMDIYAGENRTKISGIEIFYSNNLIDVQVPLNHLSAAEVDISSIVRVRGQFEMGQTPRDDVLSGQIQTEGTVVNWKPVATEATFDFTLSSEQLQVLTSNFLGGITVNGEMDFRDDFRIDVRLEALNYALSNLEFLVGGTGLVKVPGSVDLDASIDGDPWAPTVQVSLRLHDVMAGRRSFKALDLNLEGVYPTVKLTDSRVLMPDGTVMRLADTTLEVSELFHAKTLTDLIGDAQQDSVVWGDWAISRTTGESSESDFLMQRNFGDNANVHFRRLGGTHEMPDRRREGDQTDQILLGFEYRLLSESLLKLEMSEGEEFVGLERKSKF